MELTVFRGFFYRSLHFFLLLKNFQNLKSTYINRFHKEMPALQGTSASFRMSPNLGILQIRPASLVGMTFGVAFTIEKK